MTASRALRGERNVSDKSRARVGDAAAKLGYKVNPAASSLMSSIRRRQVNAYRGKIAWLEAGIRLPNGKLPPWIRPLFESMRSRADQSGYLLDHICMNDPHVEPGQLTSLLQARGVQGIILGDFHPHLEQFQWDRFACAMTRSWPQLPSVHRAGADLAFGVRECFHRLRALGYRRIGMMIHSMHESERSGIERAVYMLEISRIPQAERVPVLLLRDEDMPDRPAVFGAWVRRHKPDAVICYDENVLDWAKALGLAVPGELGLAHLARHAYLTPWAGINQHEDQIASAAVDLVVGQLVRGEFGLPPFQKEVLIKGHWVPGDTVRKQPGPTALKASRTHGRRAGTRTA